MLVRRSPGQTDIFCNQGSLGFADDGVQQVVFTPGFWSRENVSIGGVSSSHCTVHQESPQAVGSSHHCSVKQVGPGESIGGVGSSHCTAKQVGSGGLTHKNTRSSMSFSLCEPVDRPPTRDHTTNRLAQQSSRRTKWLVCRPSRSVVS